MQSVNIKLPGEGDYFMDEGFNVLRTNIQFCGKDVKRIVLTSVHENEGKTTVSLHLGKSLAELGKRVLVIDADMRKSVIAGRNSEVHGVKGLSEVLSGQERLQECIYATNYENLNILFAGQYPPNPVSLLNDVYFDKTLEAVSNVYDYIIIDTPPLGEVIDAAVIASKCDSSVLVIGSKNVKHADAEDVVAQLDKSGSKVLGVILNNSESRRHKYYK